MKIGPYELKSLPTPASSERKVASPGRSDTAASSARVNTANMLRTLSAAPRTVFRLQTRSAPRLQTEVLACAAREVSGA